MQRKSRCSVFKVSPYALSKIQKSMDGLISAAKFISQGWNQFGFGTTSLKSVRPRCKDTRRVIWSKEKMPQSNSTVVRVKVTTVQRWPEISGMSVWNESFSKEGNLKNGTVCSLLIELSWYFICLDMLG